MADGEDWLRALVSDEDNALDRAALERMFPGWPDFEPRQDVDAWWGGVESGQPMRVGNVLARTVRKSRECPECGAEHSAGYSCAFWDDVSEQEILGDVGDR